MRTELDRLISACTLRQDFDSRIQAQVGIVLSRSVEILIALGVAGCAALVLYFNAIGKPDAAGSVQAFKDSYFGSNGGPYVSGDAHFSQAVATDIAAVESMSPEMMKSISNGITEMPSFTDVSPTNSLETFAPTTELSAVEKFAILQNRTPGDINNWLNKAQNRLNLFNKFKGPKFNLSPEKQILLGLTGKALARAKDLFNTCMDQWMTVKEFASASNLKPLVTSAGQVARGLIDKLMMYGDSIIRSGESPSVIESQLRALLKTASDELLRLSATEIDTIDPLLRGLESYIIELAKELAAMAAGKGPLF